MEEELSSLIFQKKPLQAIEFSFIEDKNAITHKLHERHLN